MEAATIIALVVAVVVVLGAAGAMWRYLESKIERARLDAVERAVAALEAAVIANAAADLARQDLASFKTHVAETYVTKEGMHEQTAEIMQAIRGVGGSVDRLNERIDRVIEQRATAARRRPSVAAE